MNAHITITDHPLSPGLNISTGCIASRKRVEKELWRVVFKHHDADWHMVETGRWLVFKQDEGFILEVRTLGLRMTFRRRVLWSWYRLLGRLAP